MLRIEPPLIADETLCDRLVQSLRRLLDILQRGAAGELLAHLMDGASRPDAVQVQRAAKPASARRLSRGTLKKDRTRFAFVVHLLTTGDLRRLEFDAGAIHRRAVDGVAVARRQVLSNHSPLDELAIEATNGRVADGELIVLPHLPSELLALSGSAAVTLVQNAVDLASERGAKVVGLGGFSSIVADGGLALRQRPGLTITSGNSLTTWTAIRSVEAACAKHGLALAECTVAVVGASGAIGHALSLLCAERAAQLILVGNPLGTEASLGKLREVADNCRRHIAARAAAGRKFTSGTWAARIARGPTSAPRSEDVGITITTDINQHLPRAHIVLSATSAVRPVHCIPPSARGRADLRRLAPFSTSPRTWHSSAPTCGY